MARLVKHLALGVGAGPDLSVVGLSPASGTPLNVESA